MRSWRSSLARAIPPALLRRVSPLLLKSRRGGSWKSATSAGTLRTRNILALRKFLEASSSVYRQGTRDGVTTFVVEPSPGGSPDRLRSDLEASGLEVVRDSLDADAVRRLSVVVEKTGYVAFDAAVGAVLRVPVHVPEPALADVLEPAFPIDLVYTWVDGSDPRWQRRRRDAESREQRPLVRTSNDDARFTSHDELRYSLRSVEYFAPWVRKIFIVTAGQVPAWLETSTGKVHIVDHVDVFRNSGDLPTFNSHAIESQLHHIPGLAEHFIYMNDDVFLGDSVHPSDFFTPVGQTRFFVSEEVIRAEGDAELPVDIAAKNNRRIIEERFGKTTTRKFKHAPHAQRKSVLQQVETENAEAVALTAAARFRSATDLSIPSSLAHYYGLGLGTAVPSSIGYAYTDVSDRDAQLRLLRMLRAGMPPTFCLNEVEGGNEQGRSGETARMLANFLMRAYPIPASHERNALRGRL